MALDVTPFDDVHCLRLMNIQQAQLLLLYQNICVLAGKGDRFKSLMTTFSFWLFTKWCRISQRNLHFLIYQCRSDGDSKVTGLLHIKLLTLTYSSEAYHMGNFSPFLGLFLKTGYKNVLNNGIMDGHH